MSAVHSILVHKSDEDKVMVLDSQKLLGASGEGGDRVQFTDEFITSLKKGKGSPMEACLASRAIGFLAITVGNGSTAKEIMEQSLPHLEKAVLSALDCLATTTFVGANNWEETEKSMEIMWDIIQWKSRVKDHGYAWRGGGLLSNLKGHNITKAFRVFKGSTGSTATTTEVSDLMI